MKSSTLVLVGVAPPDWEPDGEEEPDWEQDGEPELDETHGLAPPIEHNDMQRDDAPITSQGEVLAEQNQKPAHSLPEDMQRDDVLELVLDYLTSRGEVLVEQNQKPAHSLPLTGVAALARESPHTFSQDE